MFGHAVKIVSPATLAAAVLAIGLAAAPPAAAVDSQTLVGSWAGPATLGETGECGTSAGIFAFSPNGAYRYVGGYENCAMVMIDGRYELQADGGELQLSMDECGDPGCPPGPSTLTTSISAIDPDTIVLDGRNTYLRQHG
jgi:hypothetical protein